MPLHYVLFPPSVFSSYGHTACPSNSKTCEGGGGATLLVWLVRLKCNNRASLARKTQTNKTRTKIVIVPTATLRLIINVGVGPAWLGGARGGVGASVGAGTAAEEDDGSTVSRGTFVDDGMLGVVSGPAALGAPSGDGPGERAQPCAELQGSVEQQPR